MPVKQKSASGIAVVKLTVYCPVPLSVIELTFPLARIATVPVPLKLTHALAAYRGAVPVTVATCAELMLGVVKVGLATVVASVDAPVMVPLPLIVIGIIYSYKMLMEPASKVSVPLTVVMRTRSSTSDNDLLPPP